MSGYDVSVAHDSLMTGVNTDANESTNGGKDKKGKDGKGSGKGKGKGKGKTKGGQGGEPATEQDGEQAAEE
eukprot:12723548-Alexandrium_andersonii.AAC.1